MRLKLFLRSLIAIAAVVGGLYFIAAIRYYARCSVARPSCLEHLKAGCSIDGGFKVQIGSREVDATCDMVSDGGGWTLVANYLHRGEPNSPASVRALIDRLPIKNGDLLGEDERGTPAWGHASTTVLSALPFKEVRFSCQTSAHTRKLDFSVFSPSCLSYFRTGKGSCLGTPELRDELRRNVRALENHDGHLPLTADKGHRDMGDSSITDYPFFIDWRDNWSLGDRWQCDDTQATDRNNTRHQVWVR